VAKPLDVKATVGLDELQQVDGRQVTCAVL
jgi:hypothetical protein